MWPRFDLKGQLRVKRDLPGGTNLALDGIVAMELEADVPNIIAANPTIDQVCQTHWVQVMALRIFSMQFWIHCDSCEYFENRRRICGRFVIHVSY